MIRSFLFAPATSERKVLKALDSDADAVIIDLEDAVAIDQKPAARRGLADILARPRSRPAYVRINALATPFCFRDLTEVAGAGLDGIVLPKVERADEIRTADWVLSQIEAENRLTPGRIELVPIIETARGIEAAAAIATAA